jgi:hypothetical protein
LVLTAFLGLNSLTGNESNTTITTSSAQLSNDQDLPAVSIPTEPASEDVVDVVVNNAKSISVDEYADHMTLSLAQLETVTLMLSVLDQTDGGPAPTE